MGPIVALSVRCTRVKLRWGAGRPKLRLSFLFLLAGLTAGHAQAQPRTKESTTFTVGTATAARGQKATGTIEVPAGSDAALSIPVAVFQGARPGPVLALVSGAHGTEYASIIALEKMIGLLNPAEISGTVIIVAGEHPVFRAEGRTLIRWIERT